MSPPEFTPPIRTRLEEDASGGPPLAARFPAPVIATASRLAAAIASLFGQQIDLGFTEERGPVTLRAGRPPGPWLHVEGHGHAGGGAYDGGLSSYTVRVEGLEVAGAPVRFAILLEDTDLNGWYDYLRPDERSAAARALRDALEA